MKHHEHYTELEQDQLDWISRFADRLRLMQSQFAEENAGQRASEIASVAWERRDWQTLSPEDAADRWLREQPVPCWRTRTLRAAAPRPRARAVVRRRIQCLR